MTIINERQQKMARLKELSQISRQRYLEAGGNPHLSVGSLNNNDRLTETEQQELRELLNQLVKDEDISQYFEKNGTWRDKIAVKP